MKKKILIGSVFACVALSVTMGVVFSTNKASEIDASSYSTFTPPTTIDLNDASASTVRSYYSNLSSLSTSERQGTNLLKNLKPILKNNQRYLSYGSKATAAVWKSYEIVDRDWTKSPASAISGYNSSTNKITGYSYGSSSTSPGTNPYVRTLYINRNVDNQAQAWGSHEQTEWGFNQEHVWAKSCGFDDDSKAVGARGDLMHLWPGNGYANNIHSNHFYGNVDTTVKYTDCGSKYSYVSGNLRGQSKTFSTIETVFEPQDSDKGDIARAIFYMAARYNYYSGSDSDGIDAGNPNLCVVNSGPDTSSGYTCTTTNPGKMGILQDLLEWNRLDPPDEYEIHRNNILYNSFTYNRNPFIDFPEWAEYIWGKSTNGSYSSSPTGYATPSTDLINDFGQGKTLSSIAVSGEKTSYVVGDAFVKPTVTATYNDATTANVTNSSTFTGYDLSTPGNYTVTVSYTEGTTKTTTYNITVTAPTLTSIEVSDPKTSYEIGDTFVKPTVTATYSNLTTKDVTESATFSGYDLSTAGNYTVAVSYTENDVTKDTSYNITVTKPAATLSSIAVSNQKLSYNVGDSFVKPTVTATYNDESTLDVTNSATFTGFDSTTAGTKTITVSYTENSVTKTESYDINVQSDDTVVLGFSSQGYANQEVISSLNVKDITADLSKGSGSVTPKYYIDGNSVRVYAGGIITISSSNRTITGITFTFGSDDGSNEITADVGSFSSSTWTGETDSVTFTIGGSSGNRRIKSISVTFEEPEPTVESVTVSPSTLSIIKGETSTLTATVNVTGGAAQTVNWSTSDSSIATVSSDGTVTAVAVGSTTITATSTIDSTKSGTCFVTVQYVPENTAATAFTTSQIKGYIDAGSLNYSNNYYVKGTYVNTVTEYSTQYKNITINVTDGVNQFQYYRMKIDSVKTFTTSDEVVVIGSGDKYKNYYGNYQCAIGSWISGGSDPVVSNDDLITASNLAATNTTYTNFSNVSISGGSSAVYAGNSAKTSGGAIQLRATNNNSGIVSTTSGGMISKVTVVWDSDTYSGRTVEIYGSNTAYSSASDLYDSSTKGTLLGTIVYGTSTELTITGCYKYVGLRSSSGTLYLTSVQLSWNTASDQYGQYFLSTLTCDATGATAPSTTSWNELSGIFDLLDSTDKALFTSGVASESGNNLAKCLARYDYVVSKYGSSTYSDFMNRNPSSANPNVISIFNSSNNNTWIIVTVSLVGLTSIGGYFFYKKRKEN